MESRASGTREGGASRPGSSRSDDDLIAPLVGLGFAAAVLYGLWRWWSGDGQQWTRRHVWYPIRTAAADAVAAVEPFIVPAVVVSAGIAVWWGWRRVRRRLRARQLLEVGQALVPLMPVEFDPETVRGRRWRGMLPMELRWPLPVGCKDHDPDWRTKVATTLAARLNVREVSVSWPGLRRRNRTAVARITDARPPAGPDEEPDESEVPTDADGNALDETQVRVQQMVKGLVPDPTPGPVTYDEQGSPRGLLLSYGETTRDQSMQWRGRVERQLSQRLGMPLRGTWDTVTRTVALSEVPQLPEVLPWAYPEQWPKLPSGLILPHGIDEDGRLVAWELGTRQPHGSVVGPTGTGKTETLISITACALAQGALAVIASRKPKDLLLFMGQPGVGCVASELADILALIDAVHELVLRRTAASGLRQLQEAHPELAQELPPQAQLDEVRLLFVFDELTQFIDELISWWASLDKVGRRAFGVEQGPPPWISKLVQIAQLARSAGIHLLLGLQRPDVKNFGDSTQMRDNLPFGVSMGRMSPIGSDQQWGDRQTGVIDVQHVGEGVSNGMRVVDGEVAEVSRPGRFKAFYLNHDVLRSDRLAHMLREIAPDTNLLDLGKISDAARDPAAAAAVLRVRAYGTATVGGELSASLPAVPNPQEQPAVASQDDEAPATTPEELAVEGDESLVWAPIKATDIQTGDVISFGDLEAAEVADADWDTDDVSGDEVYRLTLQVDGREQVYDLDPDEIVHAKRPARR